MSPSPSCNWPAPRAIINPTYEPNFDVDDTGQRQGGKGHGKQHTAASGAGGTAAGSTRGSGAAKEGHQPAGLDPGRVRRGSGPGRDRVRRGGVLGLSLIHI